MPAQVLVLTVMRSVFDGGEGVTSGGRSDRSSDSGVLRPFEDRLEERDSAGDDGSDDMVQVHWRGLLGGSELSVFLSERSLLERRQHGEGQAVLSMFADDCGVMCAECGREEQLGPMIVGSSRRQLHSPFRNATMGA